MSVHARSYAQPKIKRIRRNFFQIGFILYPPGSKSKWNGDEHSHKMTITVIFAVHLAASLLFLALVGLFTYQVSFKNLLYQTIIRLCASQTIYCIKSIEIPLWNFY